MEFKKYLEKLLYSKEKTKYILIIGMVGILLISISTLLPKNSNDKNMCGESKNLNLSTEAYVQQLEQKINSMISQIEGVGNSEVVITLENGVENVYANSERKTSDSNENASGKQTNRNNTQHDVVIVDGSGGKQALIVTQKEPSVKGVVVVCEGADNSLIVKRVSDAVTKSLDIKTNRVSVVKRAAGKK